MTHPILDIDRIDIGLSFEAVTALRARPVAWTYDIVVPVIDRAGEWLERGALHTVVATERHGEIGPADPAIHGAHLHGHEGRLAVRLTVEVRVPPRRTSLSPRPAS